MATTLQECINILKTGQTLAWGQHGSHGEGSITLDNPNARRLFDFLSTHDLFAVSKGEESIFPGLIAAWGKEDFDPKDIVTSITSITGISGFRLAEIETDGFGGLNNFNGPIFKMSVDRVSWCLEGQNGSGKTSLASAIIWGLTGQRVRENFGPVADKGNREPVLDGNNNKIGEWPPLASYPISREDLSNDAEVRVKLVFRDANGNDALVERTIVSKADGTTETLKNSVDPRLLSAPQLLESGLLMPSRMAHISFGERSQSLYEAVKALTGLDQLGAIGDGAANLTHGARKFLKYSKDKGVDNIKNNYDRFYAATKDPSEAVKLDLKQIANISDSGTPKKLNDLIISLSKTAGDYAETLKAVIADQVDVSLSLARSRLNVLLPFIPVKGCGNHICFELP